MDPPGFVFVAINSSSEIIRRCCCAVTPHQFRRLAGVVQMATMTPITRFGDIAKVGLHLHNALLD